MQGVYCGAKQNDIREKLLAIIDSHIHLKKCY